MLLGCIGDDFTGSSDLANTLARQGVHVAQYAGVPSGPADPAIEAGVVALKSRTIPVSEAVALSLKALEWLQAQGCRQFLFKYCSTFDSTRKGNIGPVAAALAEALDARKVLVCPAFPAAGRSIYQGHLFVNDKLLNESGMEDHSLTPMSDPDLRRWLGYQTDMPVGHVGFADIAGGPETIRKALAREDAAGHRLIVTDAITNDNLFDLGAAVADLPFLTGGSGIAMGLARNMRKENLRGHAAAPWRGNHGPAFLLSGSCSGATRGQVARHIETGAPAFQLETARLVSGETTPEMVAEWVQAQSGLPLVYSTTEPSELRAAQEEFGREKAAAAVESFFAALARILVAAGYQRIVVAGGETSSAVVEALDIEAMEIGPEIATGVPAMAAGPLGLALKSGNFGGPDFFAEAITVMETGA